MDRDAGVGCGDADELFVAIVVGDAAAGETDLSGDAEAGVESIDEGLLLLLVPVQAGMLHASVVQQPMYASQV